MKIPRFTLLFISLTVTAISFNSCKKDDDGNNSKPIALGSSVTVKNTFQSTAFTGGAEVAIEDLFQVPPNSLAATATVASSVEFPAYLLGLYNINLSENSISFTLVAQEGDPTYGELFRTLEAGTFDRYYFTFEDAQNITGFTSSNPSVNLRIDSNKIVVVEIGEGFMFQPGASFTITLN